MSKQQRDALNRMFRNLPFSIEGDPAVQRAAMEAALTAAPLPPDVTVTEGTLGGIPVVQVDVDGVDTSRTLLHFHGGVYVLGSARSSVGLAAGLGRHAGVRVISVDYRLAPEQPYPAAVEDALAAYKGLLANTAESRIAVSGESAGGGLAAALQLRLKEEGLALPAASVLLSPWTDLTLSGRSLTGKASVDPSVLTAEGLKTRAYDYLGGADPRNPEISPVFGDLSGLPPMLIQVGSHEILLDDALRLAATAAAHDVDVKLEVTAGVPHVFQAFAEVLDEGKAALASIGGFLRAHLADASTD
ncbi:alpha/beta hydrolase [Actinacidiphila acididurans]|uniref:Alpha/beta hydrolase n=1 Tax=Actinacidiphila acididurans TaxID=2784346 RepID=A0ABS2TUX7_9ACTN|nr:alpha/beta hydrolase [Actinacidiphila acididurans]MBM9506306.1 alpha/beta hydrolase [Actinacidiphila acididurans]